MNDQIPNDQKLTPPPGKTDSNSFEMPKSVSPASLEERFKDAGKALDAYTQICSIGGFGSFGADFAGGLPALDLSGITDSDKLSQIEKLLK